jgi:rod shape-determining protein MreC
LLALHERLPLSTLSGEIIGREAGGWVRALTVNRGRGNGITRQAPVIVPEGLVGRVVQVRAGASVVQLLNDPASTVGAVVQRTRTPGLVEGDAAGVARFKFMARDGAQVTKGDLVVTSGLGNLFPKGLPIGRVAAVEDKGSALFHFAVLTPTVDVARLEEVLLVTGESARDVAGFFTPDG